MRQLLILVLLVALWYLLLQVLSAKRRKRGAAPRGAPTVVTEEMVQDPFCHTYLPRSQATRRKIQGREYFFCSPGCAEKFLSSRT